MPNISDYLDWRGDLSFAVSPFNEVDNLILSMLSFIDYSPAVPSDPLGTPVKLSDTLPAVREKYPFGEDFGEIIPSDVNSIFEKAALSARFSDTYVAAYRNVIEESEVTQFAAVTFILPDDSVFIAFRGTDDTLVGWREDFHLSFSHPVRAQQLARDYLIEVAMVFSGKLRLGGHSKGGNLAVYASVFAPKPIRDRILVAYSNDGPGFLQEIIESPEFREMDSRICTIVPQSSVVGMLLGHTEEYHVIESTIKNGILQHDPFSWEVLGPQFVHLGELSADGKRHNEALAEWLDAMSPEKRREFTDTVFTILGSTGAKTVTDLSSDRIGKTIAAIRTYNGLDKEAKENFINFLRKFTEANRHAMRNT